MFEYALSQEVPVRVIIRKTGSPAINPVRLVLWTVAAAVMTAFWLITPWQRARYIAGICPTGAPDSYLPEDSFCTQVQSLASPNGWFVWIHAGITTMIIVSVTALAILGTIYLLHGQDLGARGMNPRFDRRESFLTALSIYGGLAASLIFIMGLARVGSDILTP
jgi:hypothetical protein